MRISDDAQKGYYSSTIKSLRTNGNHASAEMLKKATPQLIDTRYDNWNAGMWFYTLYLYLKLADYNQLDDKEREKQQNTIFATYSKLFDDDTDQLEAVEIKPLIEQQLDWDALNGSESKQSVLKKISEEKAHLIKVGTGQTRIQDCEEYYKALHSSIILIFSALGIEHPLDFNSLWDWYSYYSKNIPTWRERRQFISDEYSSIIDLISNSDDTTINSIKYEPTGWKKIDISVQLLTKELNEITDRINLNQIGVRCRETIILLAREVYDDAIHHPSSFTGTISLTDSSRMLEGYIEYNFIGSANDEKRRYAKITNNLANNLSHKQTATLVDTKLCLSATLSLINIIKIVNDELIKNKESDE